MKIVALVIPESISWRGQLWADFKIWLRNLVHFNPRALAALLWLFWVIFGITWSTYSVLTTDGWLRFFTFAMWVLCLTVIIGTRVMLAKLRTRVALNPKIRKRIMQEHPHVMVYETWAEAVQNHPLSDPKSFQND